MIPVLTHLYPLTARAGIQTITITFKRSGNNENVTGLALDDFSCGRNGRNLSGSGHTYTLKVAADTVPSLLVSNLELLPYCTNGEYANPSTNIPLNRDSWIFGKQCY